MVNTVKDNHISAKRIGQIRQVLKNTKKENLKLMVSDVKNSIRAIIFAAYPQSNETNKPQITLLRNFINNYISGTRHIDDVIELTNRIEYYEYLFNKCRGDIEEDHIDNSFQLLSRKIEKLLTHGSIIPNTKDENEFNKEMMSLMNRLVIRMEKEKSKSGFSISNEEDKLLGEMKEGEDYYYGVAINEKMTDYRDFSLEEWISYYYGMSLDEWINYNYDASSKDRMNNNFDFSKFQGFIKGIKENRRFN